MYSTQSNVCIYSKQMHLLFVLLLPPSLFLCVGAYPGCCMHGCNINLRLFVFHFRHFAIIRHFPNMILLLKSSFITVVHSSVIDYLPTLQMRASKINSRHNRRTASATKEWKLKLSILKGKKRDTTPHHSLCLGFLQLNPMASEEEEGKGGGTEREREKKKTSSCILCHHTHEMGAHQRTYFFHSRQFP